MMNYMSDMDDLDMSPFWDLDCPMLPPWMYQVINLIYTPGVWWPVAQLRSLDISGDGMDYDKLAELVCAQWSPLEDLHFSGPG